MKMTLCRARALPGGFKGASVLPALAVALMRTAAAQTQEIVSLEACPTSAEIDMQLVQSVTNVDQLERIGDSDVYARDSRGRVFTSHFGASGVVSVFGPEGELAASISGEDLVYDGDDIPRPLGTLSGIVVSPGDTVHVFDRSGMTHWTFSPALELVRRAPLPGPPYWGRPVRLSSGSWVMSADIRTETEVGWPLHLVGPDGNLEASFGTATRIYLRDLPTLVQRVLAPGDGDATWAAHVGEYRIELWDATDGLRRTLVRDVPWFRPWVRHPSLGADAPRNPTVLDLAVDQSGNLWLLVARASERFRDFLLEHRPGAYTWTNAAGYHSSVVEVIDPDAGCIVAGLETEVFLKRSLGRGMYAAYDLRDEVPWMDLWQLRIQGR